MIELNQQEVAILSELATDIGNNIAILQHSPLIAFQKIYKAIEMIQNE